MSAKKASTRRRWPPRPAALDALIEEAIIDANGASEERVGFYTMLEEHLAVPFDVELLGVTVTVERIEMTDDERIVAVCRPILPQRLCDGRTAACSEPRH